MKQYKVEMLLNYLGSRNVKLRPNGYMVGSCPFAPFRHTNGNDTHASFAIYVNNDGPSHFHCYTCNFGGDLNYLVNALRWKYKTVGVDVSMISRIVSEDEVVSIASLEQALKAIEHDPRPVDIAGMRLSSEMAGKLNVLKKDIEAPPMPESELDPFRKFHINAWMYLQGPQRKLTVDTIRDWELGWYPKEYRIVIPIRDMGGALRGYSRRLLEDQWVFHSHRKGLLPFTGPKRPKKYFNSKGIPRNMLLYGEHKRDEESRVGILVEGFFDVIYLKQLGYKNVLAIMGTGVSPMQKYKLTQWFDRVVYYRDGDYPGKNSAERLKKDLKNILPLAVTDTPDGVDANSASPEENEKILKPYL